MLTIARELLDDLRFGSMEDKLFALFFASSMILVAVAVVVYTVVLFTGSGTSSDTHCSTIIIGKGVYMICE